MQKRSIFQRPGTLLVAAVMLILLIGLVAYLISRPTSPPTAPATVPTTEASNNLDLPSTSIVATPQATQPAGVESLSTPLTPIDVVSPTPGEQPTTGASGWDDTVLAPHLSISVNGGGEVEIFRGWPLLVHAEILHPAVFGANVPEAPLLIAVKQAPWSNALRIEALSNTGDVQTWPFHLAETPTSTLALDPRNDARLDWWISPEESNRLSPGSYEVIAYLDTRQITTTGTWRGSVSSVPATVQVAPEPVALSPEQLSLKYRLLAHYSLLRGDQAVAQSHVETLLSMQPDDFAGLELKGDLLILAGKTQEALLAYEQALSLYIQEYPDAEEPPETLLLKKSDALDKLLAEQP
jgi:hypothetical protein